jgi:hypothetical protein
MLVASRDLFHSGTHQVSAPEGSAAVPRFVRAMNVLQIVGTLLAIPVGLGSAYSMYRANFTVEATCQSLRGNIVAMLDKSVDPNTSHMLVRRDVEAFENACGTVDPDATAAFKALLAADKAEAPAAASIAKPVEARAEPVPRKPEPHPAVAVKQTAPAPVAVKAEAEAAPRDAALDAVWIAAVRHALVNHAAEPKPAAEQVKAAAVAPAPLAEPVMPAASTLTPIATPSSRVVLPQEAARSQPMTLAPPAAPALPPPMAVAVVPAPQVDDGHPVPPASIPEPPSLPKEASVSPARHSRSRLGGLVAQIPLLGWAFDR